MKEGGGDEVGSGEDLEVALGGVVALGAVDDGLGRFVPGDLLEGGVFAKATTPKEGMAEEIFGKALAALMVAGPDPLVIGGVDIETGVFPVEEVGEFLRADEPGFAEGVEEAVPEQLDGGGEAFGRHAVEGAVGGEEPVSGEDMQVGMEDEVVSEGVNGGNGSEFALREVETGAKVVAEAFGGSAKEKGEMGSAFAEDAAENLGNGEDKLAMRDFVADGGGDPFAGAAYAALVAGGAEMAAFAGEGEESLVATIGTLEAGETGGEVAATEKGFDGGDGLASERAETFAMSGFVLGEEVIPAVVDELPKGRGAGPPGLVDGGHVKCS
jgi:hypothetical protein